MTSKAQQRRDTLILAFLKRYIAANRRPPTLREIAAPFGMTRETAAKSLDRLAAAGLIERTPRKSRAVRVLSRRTK